MVPPEIPSTLAGLVTILRAHKSMSLRRVHDVFFGVGSAILDYLALAYEMATHLRQSEGEAPPNLHDLDTNEYFPCAAREPHPWGARFGQPVPTARG